MMATARAAHHGANGLIEQSVGPRDRDRLDAGVHAECPEQRPHVVPDRVATEVQLGSDAVS